MTVYSTRDEAMSLLFREQPFIEGRVIDEAVNRFEHGRCSFESSLSLRVQLGALMVSSV